MEIEILPPMENDCEDLKTRVLNLQKTLVVFRNRLTMQKTIIAIETILLILSITYILMRA